MLLNRKGLLGPGLGKGGSSQRRAGAAGVATDASQAAQTNTGTYENTALAIANSSEGSLFYWGYFPAAGQAGNQMILAHGDGADDRLQHLLDGGNTDFELTGFNTSNSLSMPIDSNSVNTPATDQWVAMFLDWDRDSSSANLYHQPQGSAASDQLDDNNYVAAGPFDLSFGDWYLYSNSASALQCVDIRISQLWFSSTRIDFSVAGNREDFVTAAGQPIDLGPAGDSQGQTPEIWVPNGDPVTAGFSLTGGSAVTIVAGPG